MWHFELDQDGQPTGKKLPDRRESAHVVPVTAARRRGPQQSELALEDKVTTTSWSTKSASMSISGAIILGPDRGMREVALDLVHAPHELIQSIDVVGVGFGHRLGLAAVFVAPGLVTPGLVAPWFVGRGLEAALCAHEGLA